MACERSSLTSINASGMWNVTVRALKTSALGDTCDWM